MRKRFLAVILFLTLCFSGAITPAYAKDIESFMEGIGVTDSGFEEGSLDGSDGTHDLDANSLFAKYKDIAAFITGILTITSLFALFVNIGKLSTTLSNEFSRKRTIVGIATSAIGVALMGGATIIIAFFYQFF